MSNLINLEDASKWGTKFIDKKVKPSNISYLIQYGRIKEYKKNGQIMVSLNELRRYYKKNHKSREDLWKAKLGDDLNWHLSFDKLREKDTTKHVHRLHQYKGKFIPQLVEYFIDDHTDEFKKNVYFRKGDIILDPFCGSGTTLIQANELGLDSIGVDISRFNCLISECKIKKYNINKLKQTISYLNDALNNKTTVLFNDPIFDSDEQYNEHRVILKFENELYNKMNEFNHKYFPNKEYKYKVNQGEIDEKEYSDEKEKQFLKIYKKLIKKYEITPYSNSNNTFLDKWFMDNIKNEMLLLKKYIKKTEHNGIKELLKIVLSKTIRSCRATTHYNLAHLKSPQTKPYYCKKHNKICKPLYTLKNKFRRYAKNTVKRIEKFECLRTNANYSIIQGDSRELNIFKEVKKSNKDFYNKLKKQKIRGIFTSPPYVGQINYHEQHAYAYELLDFKRQDNKEIGPKFDGKSKKAKKQYSEGIINVLTNCQKFLADKHDIFIVANDKHNLYPEIFKNAKMKIINKFRRPVLNRTSRDRNPYSESIFHVRAK